MRLLSWNVNGLRSALKKDFLDWLKGDHPEIIGLQESRVKPEQLPESFHDALRELGYESVWSTAEKAGYSGTALFSRVGGELFTGLAELDEGLAEWDREGRVTGWRQGNRLLLNVYFLNGGASDERLAYKMAFYADFQKLCEREVLAGRELIVCGDLNTAHREIDLARPKENRTVSGFLPEECAWVDAFLAGKESDGMVDSYRHFHPDEAGAYSWWSFRSGARSRNVGWRLDYFFISHNLVPKLKTASIRQEVMGSDHCPVEITLL